MELIDWVSELLSRPMKEYTRFEAGLSLAAVLPPEDVTALLEQRCERLEVEVAQAASLRGLSSPRSRASSMSRRSIAGSSRRPSPNSCAASSRTSRRTSSRAGFWRKFHAGEPRLNGLEAFAGRRWRLGRRRLAIRPRDLPWERRTRLALMGGACGRSHPPGQSPRPRRVSVRWWIAPGRRDRRRPKAAKAAMRVVEDGNEDAPRRQLGGVFVKSLCAVLSLESDV